MDRNLGKSTLPFGLLNGDFSKVACGRAGGWDEIDHYRILDAQGYDGSTAVELKCSGPGDSSGVSQKLKFDVPRQGAFCVSVMGKCLESYGYGGDFLLWVTATQEDGTELSAAMNMVRNPDLGWQRLETKLWPDKPVTETHIRLLIRDLRATALFSNVSIDDMSLEVRQLRVLHAGGLDYDVRAMLSEKSDWRLVALQQGREIWSADGSGTWATEGFTAPEPGKVTVRIGASCGSRSASAEVDADQLEETAHLEWWIEEPTTKVFQDDLPPAHPVKAVMIDAARNNRVSFQVALRPFGTGLNSIRVHTDDLVLQESEKAAVMPGSAVEWHRVGYVWFEMAPPGIFAERTEPAWWPDPLLPPLVFDVKPYTVQPLWFTVHVPEDALPGCYKGSIRICAVNIESFDVPVEINVYSAVIPGEVHLKNTFSLMDGHMKKIYGEITPKLRRAYTDFLVAHRLNLDDISRTEPSDLDELRYMNSRGLNAFNILNVVPEPVKPVLWVCAAPEEAYTSEFKETFLQRLDKIVPEIRKRGLADKAYVYGWDERGASFVPIIKDFFGAIKERFPDIHTLSTAWVPSDVDPFAINIDWHTTFPSWDDKKLSESIRQRGGEVWWYETMWAVESPTIIKRLILWQTFLNGADGFLFWAINLWERERNDGPVPLSADSRVDFGITTGGGCPALHGDGTMVYPGPNGPIGSARLAAIRDGMEDIELLWLYREKFGKQALTEIVSDVFADVEDINHYSLDMDKLKQCRRRILQAL